MKSVFFFVVFLFALPCWAQNNGVSDLFAVSNFPDFDLGLIDIEEPGFDFTGSTGASRLGGLAINSKGQIYSASNPFFSSEIAELFRIDSVTGQATSLFELDLIDIGGLAFSSQDVLYVINREADLQSVIYTLDITTGQASLVGRRILAILYF